MSKKVKTKKPKKERTEADRIIALQLVKAATAVICAVAVCTSLTASVGKISEAKIKSAEAFATAQGESGSNSADSFDTGFSSIDQGTTDSSTTDNTATDLPADAGTTDSGTAADTKTDAGKSDNEWTNAKIVEYCNKALNDAKAAKVGYTKTFVRKGGDNLPGIITKVLAQNKTTTVQKGDAKIKDDFPAAGFDWSSKLRESDLKSVDFKQNGQYYEITLKLKDENNPAKGEASSYGKVMSVIDANDAKEMVPGVKSINMKYHDGYVYAKIDAKTGKLVKAEFSAAADISATLSVFGDLSAENITSTETFTDIKW